MRILVTGGAGFIGSHLVAELASRGDEVVVLDDLLEQVHGGSWPVLPEGVQFVRAQVDDESALASSLAGVDRVVHLAAAVGVGQSMYQIGHYTRFNTMATANLLQHLIDRDDRPARLVVASSMSIYGEGAYECEEHGMVAPGPRPEPQLAAGDWELRCDLCDRHLRAVATGEGKPVLPTSVYAITKRDQEELCLVTGCAYGIPTVALRFFNVYGPGQALSNPYTGVAAIFASRLLNGNPPTIFEDGAQSRDFIHVSDIVRGIVLALDRDEAVGYAINLGTGLPSTVEDVARALAKGLGTDIAPEKLQQFRTGDIRHCYADTTKARDLLGFSARVSLEEGMSDLIQWLHGQRAEDAVDAATEELAGRGLTTSVTSST